MLEINLVRSHIVKVYRSCKENFGMPGRALPLTDISQNSAKRLFCCNIVTDFCGTPTHLEGVFDRGQKQGLKQMRITIEATEHTPCKLTRLRRFVYAFPLSNRGV